MSYKTDQKDKMVADLEKYVELEGSEWGSTAAALIQLWHYRTLLSDAVVKALEKEISDWLIDVKNNATIVERKETITEVITELEWNY
ncbi:MAG: hypothetical protein ACRDFB_10925 [Rhabdochlamydiaceae bacterium]